MVLIPVCAQIFLAFSDRTPAFPTVQGEIPAFFSCPLPPQLHPLFKQLCIIWFTENCEQVNSTVHLLPMGEIADDTCKIRS